MGKSIHTAQHEHLCALLIAERKNVGMTQEELAKRLGKHQSYVSKFETGERRLDVIEFMEVAKKVGFSAAALLGKLEASAD